ncbi:septum site-determining protein MinC [Thermocrinis jamiesonii]|uniref:septum site-determining protein MinC n=1 Tax=Thermocrinis jamiesonii TaxID=1302351 RepID=UPI000495C068|nr:septum site-determining protein MinC [Thermocrinis jamiesonii]
MIEIKGITLPVILIRVDQGAEESEVFERLEKFLSSKLSEGAYFLVEGDGDLTKKIEHFLIKKSLRNIRKIKASFEEKAVNRLLVVEKHLRSGQKIEHNGDVLVLGNVNKDAQIIATGNIIVMGTLRGIAVAGALGDESAVVVALRMEPQQIRIGRKIAISNEEERVSPGYPEIAKVEGGAIILERV